MVLFGCWIETGRKSFRRWLVLFKDRVEVVEQRSGVRPRNRWSLFW
jgi:hypothetical protein